LAVAVTVTAVVLETVPAVVEKVAVVAPPGTVTEAGKVKAGLLLDKLMDKPVTSAGLLNVTAQVEVSPDWKVDGLQFNHVGTAGARSVSEELTETPLSVAVIAAVVSTVTPEALAVKAAVDAPAATIIEAGVLSEARLADRVTTDPPAGAGMVKVIVQVADPVPEKEDGLQSKLLTWGTVATVRLTVVVAAVPFAATVTVTGVVPETVPAVAEKAAVAVPAGTVTEAGTLKAGLLPDKVMDKPFGGAALLRMTVHLEASPDLSVPGLQFSAVGTAGARIPSEELTDTPFRVAATVAVASAVTAEAVAVKLAVDAPAATVTEGGVLSAALLLDKVTRDPPAAAGEVKVTVQVAEAGPVMEDGLQLKLLT
jgi:hypothetical protein